MKRSAPKRRTPLRPRSKKRAKFYRDHRVPFVQAMLEAHPVCQRCHERRSVDVHELVRRSQGGSTVDEANTSALCRQCHDWIGDHPRLAEKEGWAVRGQGSRP